MAFIPEVWRLLRRASSSTYLSLNWTKLHTKREILVATGNQKADTVARLAQGAIYFGFFVALSSAPSSLETPLYCSKVR